MKMIRSMKKLMVLIMVFSLTLSGISFSKKVSYAATEPFNVQVDVKASGQEDVGGSAVVTLPTVSATNDAVLLDDEIITIQNNDNRIKNVELTTTNVTSKGAVDAKTEFETKVRFTVVKDAEAGNAVLNVYRTNVKTAASVLLGAVNVNILAPDYGTVSGSFKVGTTSYLTNAGTSKNISYQIKASSNSTGYYPIKASGYKTSVVESVVVEKDKIVVTTAKKAAKGASTKITLTSGTEKAVIKVTIANATKQVKAKKKSVKIKKGKKAKVIFTVKGANTKNKVTDTIKATSSNKKIKINKVVVSKTKCTVTVKGSKKGKAKLTLKSGSKSAKVTVKVK